LRTKVIQVDPFNPDEDALRFCAGILESGGLVAFPTETVYGLGANALDPKAVLKIFEAKGRPQDNPVIVHVSGLEQVKLLVTEISPVASRLMKTFWPGPLTLLFPKSCLVPAEVTAGLPLVAIRMPDHPVAHKLIDLANVAVAAPSANISGRPSPISADEVLSDLDGKVDVILDGGPANIGVESTVLDVSRPIPRILRPGGVPKEELERILEKVEVVQGVPRGPVPSPGMKYRHYAPKAKMYLATGSYQEQKEAILSASLRRIFSDKKVVVLASSENLPSYLAFRDRFPANFKVIELGSREDLTSVAARLFSSLRLADKAGADVIFSETFPLRGLGLAIGNRLERASGGRKVNTDFKKPLVVMMVCSGNTCRSPMAEGLLKKIWKDMGEPYPLRVISRGTSAMAGFPASSEAVSVMKKRGIDISSHISWPVVEKDLDEADLVITMTNAHKEMLLSRFPKYSKKIYTLSEMVPQKIKGDVADPIGLGEEVYERTATMLEKGLLELAEWLAGKDTT